VGSLTQTPHLNVTTESVGRLRRTPHTIYSTSL